MSWIKLTLKTNAENAEAYSDILFNAGAASVSFQDAKDQPIFEPELGSTPLWEQTFVIGLFGQDADMASVKNFLKKQLGKDILQRCAATLETLEDQNWTRAWMDQFHPMQFGQRLWICPSGHDIVDPTAVNILLDPGLAFGTGTHPTTRLCLEWLDAHAHSVDNALVVDYGCGSGILSIAAKKLGAALVFAVDHDRQALLSTEDNAKKNGFSLEDIIPVLPEALQLPKKTDLILANILANPLMELAGTFAEILQPGGMLILSGILENQAESVFQYYTEWFTFVDVVTQKGWSRISAVRI